MTSLSLSVIEVCENEAGGRGAAAGKGAGWLPGAGLRLRGVPGRHLVSEGSGRKAAQKTFRARLALPSGRWPWGRSSALGHCRTHWGFPVGLLGPSLRGLTVNSVRTLTRPRAEPWHGGEEPSPGERPGRPAGARPGLSSLKRELRRSAKGPGRGKRPRAHAGMRAALLRPGWGRGGPSTQAENARPLEAIALDSVAGRTDIWRGANRKGRMAGRGCRPTTERGRNGQRGRGDLRDLRRADALPPARAVRPVLSSVCKCDRRCHPSDVHGELSVCGVMRDAESLRSRSRQEQHG